MIIGVDLSLNSTGFCLFDEKTQKYQFLANINRAAFTGRTITPSLEELIEIDKTELLQGLIDLPDFSLDSHLRPVGQGDNFIEIGQMRLRNVKLLSASHFRTLAESEFLKARLDDITAISIEDYSVAKITDALVVTIETSSYLKQHYLLSLINGNTEKFYTIPGPKLKMLAGNGGYNKLQMLMEFVDLKEEGIYNTPFHKFCRENLGKIVRKANVASPVNDVIDAFWAVKYTKDIIIDQKPIIKKKLTKL